MTTDVTFTETGFAFTLDGTHFDVHTEVGNGPARVVVEEIAPEPVDQEPSDD